MTSFAKVEANREETRIRIIICQEMKTQETKTNNYTIDKRKKSERDEKASEWLAKEIR